MHRLNVWKCTVALLMLPVISLGAVRLLSGFSGGVSIQSSAETKSMVSGATINVVQDGTVVMDAKTDDKGLYSLQGLIPGMYSLEITKPQFVKKTVANISLGDETSINVNLDLTPSLQLSSLGVDNKAGTRNWRVLNLHNFSIPFTWSADPDQAGSGTANPGYTYFSTRIVTNGPDGIRLYVSGVLVRSKGGNGQDVAPTTGSLTGVTSDLTSGGPLQGVTVQAVNSSGVLAATATSDSTGLYSIMDIPAGTYTLNFSRTGYYDSNGNSISLVAGTVTVLNVSLEQEVVGSISGTVTDTSGAAVVAGTVAINNLDGTFKHLPVATDVNGHYSIPDLEPGIYVLTFSGPSVKGGTVYLVQQVQVTVASFQDSTVDITLVPA
jgi:large repetitive protein